MVHVGMSSVPFRATPKGCNLIVEAYLLVCKNISSERGVEEKTVQLLRLLHTNTTSSNKSLPVAQKNRE